MSSSGWTSSKMLKTNFPLSCFDTQAFGRAIYIYIYIYIYIKLAGSVLLRWMEHLASMMHTCLHA